MKTESSLGTRSPVSSGKSVLEQLSASRTPAKAGRDAASSLSFRTLMADIRPGGFEEMTQRMAERRAEQQRLEKERQRERPRAEDLHGSAQVMQRPAAEPQRSRQADEMRQAERVTKASRQAERATTTRSRDADNASARGASTAEARPASARAEETRPAAPSSTQAATRTAASESGSTSAPGDKVDADSTAATAMANQTTAASDSAAAGAASAQAAKAVDRQAPSGSSKPTELATADVPAKSSSPSSSEDSLADQVRQGAQQVQMEASPVSETELQQLARQMGLDESDTQDVNAPTDAQGTSADAAAVAVAVAKEITADTNENLSSGGEGTATVHPTMAMAPSRRAQATSASATQPAQDGRVAATGRPSTPTLPQTSSASDAASASRPATTDTSPTPLPTAAVATGRAEGGSFSLGMALPTSGAHSPVRTDGSPLLSSRIESPIHSAEFKEQFARQVAGVVVQGQDRAEIRLTPAELGPIRIRVSLNADDAALDISAAHAATRAAIESSMSTLKQMLADHGLRLSDYRMDQGNNAAFLSQQRQSGQENGAGMQQSGTAFGQNGGQSGGQQTDGGSDTGRADRTMGSRPTAVSGSTSGGAGVGNTPSNGRLDLFA